MKANSLKESLEKTYRDKTVLVTGHTGFKGAWLSAWLNELDAQVIGYSLDSPSKPSLFEACGLEQRLVHIHGDVRDLSNLVSILKKHRPAILFHLAAQSLVRRSYVEPVLTYATNMMGTVNVLEAVRSAPSVRVAIIATSDKCYENKELDRAFVEGDPMGGYDPYSSSKGCAEIIASAYRRSYFNSDRYGDHKVSVSTVRAGNVIGGGDWGQDRLIPDCMRALSSNKPIEIRNPDAVRPWQYVLDCLFGYLVLGTRMCQDGSRFSGAWNFGPSITEITTVREMVEKVIRLWGKGALIASSSRDVSTSISHREARCLRLNCTKAYSTLNWQPHYNLDRALREAIEWYKLYYDKADKKELYAKAKRQIAGYMQELSAKSNH